MRAGKGGERGHVEMEDDGERKMKERETLRDGREWSGWISVTELVVVDAL